MGRLDGKVAIVTGAARGLGKGFAMRLAEEGAKIVAFDKLLEGLPETAAEIQAKGGQCAWLQGDVTSAEDTQMMAQTAVDKFGRIDILINNAAIYYGVTRKNFYDITPEEFDRMMAVNVKGGWLCVCAVFPYMKDQGKGKIINLSSEVFFTGSHGFFHYVTSKGAVVGMTRSLAVELGPHNICVNAIAPGFTATEASATIADLSKYDVSRTPLRRLQQPEDLLGAAVFLASDDSDFITGQILLVDGGRAMH